MTPPPRGPPRFRGGPGPSGPGSARGFNSQNSSPVIGGRSRAFSSASGGQIPGLQGARGRPLQKKPLAPPVALRTLPTPHMLKEDAFIRPIDFAPANSYKERQRGIADSPRMENRPYSPAVPIASPLVSSFMELGAVPSPYVCTSLIHSFSNTSRFCPTLFLFSLRSISSLPLGLPRGFLLS